MIDPLQLGIAASGTTLVARALAPQAWLLVRPLSCDLCMSWWGSVAFVSAAMLDPAFSAASPGEWAQLLFGSTAIAVVVTKVSNRLTA